MFSVAFLSKRNTLFLLMLKTRFNLALVLFIFRVLPFSYLASVKASMILTIKHVMTKNDIKIPLDGILYSIKLYFFELLIEDQVNYNFEFELHVCWF